MFKLITISFLKTTPKFSALTELKRGCLHLVLANDICCPGMLIDVLEVVKKEDHGVNQHDDIVSSRLSMIFK